MNDAESPVKAALSRYEQLFCKRGTRGRPEFTRSPRLCGDNDAAECGDYCGQLRSERSGAKVRRSDARGASNDPQYAVSRSTPRRLYGLSSPDQTSARVSVANRSRAFCGRVFHTAVRWGAAAGNHPFFSQADAPVDLWRTPARDNKLYGGQNRLWAHRQTRRVYRLSFIYKTKEYAL